MSLNDRAQRLLERLWYQRRGVAFGALSPLFGPASLVTLAASRWRRTRTAGHAAIPVIAVGNLVVGGSGKTQIVLALAKLLQAHGARVAIVSRGYGGTQCEPAEVSAERAGAERFGDEPVLLKQRLGASVAVIVARDRLRAVALAAKLGAQVALLDDGLQQRSVRAARRIAVFGAEAPLGNGALLPLGPLRDRPNTLASDDLIWVHGEGSAVGLARVDVRSRTEAIGLFSTTGDGPAALQAGQRLYAFAGIARPERFFATLAEAGHSLVGRERFADHRRFSPDDLQKLAQRARAAGAEALVCTEKDAVRLPDVSLALPVFALHTRLIITEGEAALAALYAAAVSPGEV